MMEFMVEFMGGIIIFILFIFVIMFISTIIAFWIQSIIELITYLYSKRWW